MSVRKGIFARMICRGMLRAGDPVERVEGLAPGVSPLPVILDAVSKIQVGRGDCPGSSSGREIPVCVVKRKRRNGYSDLNGKGQDL
jgi:hypothetical protein